MPCSMTPPLTTAPIGCRPHQKTVFVVVKAGIVAVVEETEFRGVSLGKEILDIKIADINLLVSLVEGVQAAVSVFFEEIKVSQVVVKAVGAQVAEEANSGLLLGEKESAKIAGELLDSGADGNEIEVRAQVVNLGFDKRLLHSGMRVEAVDTLRGINVHKSTLAGLQEIQVDLGCNANAEVHRTKTRVALKQVEGQQEALRGEELLAFAKEALRCSAARRRRRWARAVGARRCPRDWCP